MKNFDTRVYSVSDFLEWENNELLNLSPDFQRRGVWKETAKSYLIDTLLRGKPIPKIIITQELKGKRNIRVVVDGQQRLRSILEFIDDGFKISRAHNDQFAGYTYSMLPAKVKQDLLSYELGVDVIFNLPYEEMLDIFSRLNTYTVKLNKQEQYNALFLGYYKQAAYRLGYRYVQYFLDSNILTKPAVTRMGEAELSADLLMALIGGVQARPNVEQYYSEYEDAIGPLAKAESDFDRIMSYIGAIYPASDLSQTNWNRLPLFYTLFTSLGHFMVGIKGLKPNLRVRITKQSISRLRVILDAISVRYDEVWIDKDKPSAPKDYKTFIDYSRRHTTDTTTRIYRTEFLCKKLKSGLS